MLFIRKNKYVLAMILGIVSILLNLLRLVLCPSMWSVLQNIPCVLEKNVYSDFGGMKS
jgi:hypothetical protein